MSDRYLRLLPGVCPTRMPAESVGMVHVLLAVVTTLGIVPLWGI